MLAFFKNTTAQIYLNLLSRMRDEILFRGKNFLAWIIIFIFYFYDIYM